MLKMILEQTEITTLFGSEVCLLNILKLVKGKIFTLKHVVSFDAISKDLEAQAKDMGIETILYHENI